MAITIKRQTKKKKVSVKQVVFKDEDAEHSVEASIERLHNFEAFLNDRVLFRADEIRLLLVAMLVGRNVFMLGRPGIAKSLLANTLFGEITKDADDVRFFRRQFRKGTSEDEVLGTLIAQDYREKGIWRLNTSGKLPEAHFAYLDEIFNANESLRAALFGVLNEHEFDNGGELIKCPLITAVATSNALPDDECAEAFNDRWLFLRTLRSSTTDDARMRIARLFLAGVEKRGGHIVQDDPFTMGDLLRLQRATARMEVTSEELGSFMELTRKYEQSFSSVAGGGATAGPYISDRRMCWTIHALKAAKCLTGVFGEAAAWAMHGLNTNGDPDNEARLMQAYGTTIAMADKRREELGVVQEEVRLASRLMSCYSATMTESQRKSLLAKVDEALAYYSDDDATQPSGEAGAPELSTPEAAAVRTRALKMLTELRVNLVTPDNMV